MNAYKLTNLQQTGNFKLGDTQMNNDFLGTTQSLWSSKSMYPGFTFMRELR